MFRTNRKPKRTTRRTPAQSAALASKLDAGLHDLRDYRQRIAL